MLDMEAFMSNANLWHDTAAAENLPRVQTGGLGVARWYMDMSQLRDADAGLHPERCCDCECHSH